MLKSQNVPPYGREEKPPFDHGDGYGTMRTSGTHAAGPARASTAGSSYLQKRAEIVGRRFMGGARSVSSNGGTTTAEQQQQNGPAAGPTPMVVDKVHEEGGAMMVRTSGSSRQPAGGGSASAGFVNAAANIPPAGYAHGGGSRGGPAAGEVMPREAVASTSTSSSYLPAVGNGSSSGSTYGGLWGGVPRMLTVRASPSHRSACL